MAGGRGLVLSLIMAACFYGNAAQRTGGYNYAAMHVHTHTEMHIGHFWGNYVDFHPFVGTKAAFPPNSTEQFTTVQNNYFVGRVYAGW